MSHYAHTYDTHDVMINTCMAPPMCGSILTNQNSVLVLPVTSGCFPCARLASFSLTPLCRVPGIWSKENNKILVANYSMDRKTLFTVEIDLSNWIFKSRFRLSYFPLKPLRNSLEATFSSLLQFEAICSCNNELQNH